MLFKLVRQAVVEKKKKNAEITSQTEIYFFLWCGLTVKLKKPKL